MKRNIFISSSESKKQISRIAEMKHEENEEREKKKRCVYAAKETIATYENADKNGLLGLNEVPSKIPLPLNVTYEKHETKVLSEKPPPHKNFNNILDLMTQNVILSNEKFDEMLDFITQGSVVTDEKYDEVLDLMVKGSLDFKKSTLDFICSKCEGGMRALNVRWFIMWLFQHDVALQNKISSIEEFADTILSEVIGINFLVLKEIILQDAQYKKLLSVLEKYGIKHCERSCKDCNAFYAYIKRLDCIPIDALKTHVPISALDFICGLFENGNRRVDVLELIKWVFQHKPIINCQANHRNNELQFTSAIFTEIIHRCGMVGKNPIINKNYIKETVVLRASEFDLMLSIFEKNGISISQCMDQHCCACNAFFASIKRIDCIHKRYFTRGSPSNTKEHTQLLDEIAE